MNRLRQQPCWINLTAQTLIAATQVVEKTILNVIASRFSRTVFWASVAKQSQLKRQKALRLGLSRQKEITHLPLRAVQGSAGKALSS